MRRAFPAGGCRSAALPATLAAVALLSGCKDEKRTAAPSAAITADRVREAAEEDLRSSAAAPAQAQFRGVQVYAQALPRRLAVCGQVSPFADDPNIFVPFVSIGAPQGAQDDPAPQYRFERHVATTTSEADRVYFVIVNYCYDKGGPGPGPDYSAMAMPPLPETIPDLPARGGAAQAVAPPAQSPAQPAPAQPPARHLPTRPVVAQAPLDPAADLGTVTMRQGGNLRSEPQGPILRTVPRGAVLRVFAQAAGGWKQVGDTAPIGWVHDSMLERRAPDPGASPR